MNHKTNNQAEENEMASSKTPDEFPSELHEMLGMTPAQLRQDYVDRGEDPDAVVAAMRRMGAVMAAKFEPQIERETAMASRRASPLAAPLRVFQESVAAGAPGWADGQAPSSESSILDVMSDSPAEDTILARVSGWSMRDEGINDGDFVIVNVKTEAQDGDIVLAHIAAEGQVVKRLRRRRDKVVLESANPDFADIVIDDPTSLRIHGVVVGRAGKV